MREIILAAKAPLPARPRFASSPLRRIACFFGGHGRGGIALGVTIQLWGKPIHKHQCLRCGRVYWL